MLLTFFSPLCNPFLFRPYKRNNKNSSKRIHYITRPVIPLHLSLFGLRCPVHIPYIPVPKLGIPKTFSISRNNISIRRCMCAPVQ